MEIKLSEQATPVEGQKVNEILYVILDETRMNNFSFPYFIHICVEEAV